MQKWVCSQSLEQVETHTVHLFPDQSWCPSTTTCYHIIGARMCIGLSDSYQKQKINLTQLRRNTSSRPQKKSGKKAPRTGDYEVVFAPESEQFLHVMSAGNQFKDCNN